MKRYLFFLRHFNDIDNIAPAIYFFLKESPEHRADVILYHEGYDFRNDPNLKFLEQEFPDRFTANWLGNYFGLGFSRVLSVRKVTVDLLIKVAILCEKIGLSREAISVRYRAWKKWCKNIAKKTSSNKPLSMNNIRLGLSDKGSIQGGLRKIIDAYEKPSLIVFDINRSSMVIGLLDNLRALGIGKIICLPTSPLINYNVLRQQKLVDVFSSQFVELHDYSGFDALGYVDNYFISYFNRLLPLIGHTSSLEGKTCSIGSIRFCPEWLNIREKMVPTYKGKESSLQIKVVFFLSNAQTNVHVDELQRSLILLSLFSDYYIVIKGHTRSIIKPNLATNTNMSIDYNTDSSALINWADIVIFWSTSVAIEGYIKNKFMVCLSYMSCNRNLYAEYGAGYIARCRDDLLEFLIQYKKNQCIDTYNKQGQKKFLEEVVWVKLSGKTVPELYLDFMHKYEFD